MLTTATWAAIGLYGVRTSALVLGSPILGSAGGVTSHKIGLIVFLTGFFYLSFGQALPETPDAVAFGAMALRELLIGGFLAFLLQMLMVVTQVGGEMIAHDMGFAMASQIDPETGVQTKLIPRIYEMLALLGLLALDAHHWLLRGLDESFRRAPVGLLKLEAGMAGFVVESFSQLFAAGITFAFPVLILLLFVTVMVGMLARMVPQLNVMELSFTLRIVVGLGALALLAPLLVPAIDGLARRFEGLLAAGLDVLG